LLYFSTCSVGRGGAAAALLSAINVPKFFFTLPFLLTPNTQFTSYFTTFCFSIKSPPEANRFLIKEGTKKKDSNHYQQHRPIRARLRFESELES